MSIRIGIHGASGKMGQAVLKLLPDFHQLKLGYSYSRNAEFNDIGKLFTTSDVIIDFSHAQALELVLQKALEFNKKLIIGTTALTSDQLLQMQQLATKVAIFYSPNTSIAVHLMSRAVEIAASILQQETYDITITDIHHRQKKDAPSGTSLMLASKINAVKKSCANTISADNNIEFCSIRAGNEPAKLEVMFSGQHDSLLFTHQSHSRYTLAQGALKIAIWLEKMPAGFYTMDDYIAAIKYNL